MIASEDGIVTAEGGTVASEGGIVAAEGSIVAAEGGMIALEGVIVVSEGGIVASEGDIMHLEGDITSFVGCKTTILPNLQGRLQILHRAGALAPEGAISKGRGLLPPCPPPPWIRAWTGARRVCAPPQPLHESIPIDCLLRARFIHAAKPYARTTWRRYLRQRRCQEKQALRAPIARKNRFFDNNF